MPQRKSFYLDDKTADHVESYDNESEYVKELIKRDMEGSA